MSAPSQNPNPSSRVAVITGGARGIGEAAARKFAADGLAVAILDVNREKGMALAAELGGESKRVHYYDCDVTDESVVAEVASRIESELGRASILLTSAALIPNTESIMDMHLAAHDRMWRVNYHGTVHACRVFGKQMIAAGARARTCRCIPAASKTARFSSSCSKRLPTRESTRSDIAFPGKLLS